MYDRTGTIDNNARTLEVPVVGQAELQVATIYPVNAANPPVQAIPDLGISLKRSAHLSPSLDRFGDRPLEKGNIRLAIDPVEGKPALLEALHDTAVDAHLPVVPNSAAGGERHGAHISIDPKRVQDYAQRLRETGDPALAQVADALTAFDPDKAPLQVSFRDYQRIVTGTTTPTAVPDSTHSDTYRFGAV